MVSKQTKPNPWPAASYFFFSSPLCTNGLTDRKPMRNIQFAKDEAKFAVRRVMKVGKLDGRSPDVETEV